MLILHAGTLEPLEERDWSPKAASGMPAAIGIAPEPAPRAELHAELLAI